MKDKNKTTDQLMNELVELRQRIAELEAADTERKRAEEALRESEKKYRQLVKYAPTGIYEVDLTTGRFTSVNDVMCEYAGYTREEFLSLSPVDLATEDYKERVLERQAKILAGEQIPETVEYKVRGKSGREFWVILNTRLVYEGGKPVRATVVAHDITERKRAEEALQESEARYRELADSIADVFFAMDKDLKYTYWNRASEELTGIAAKDAIGKSLYELFPDTPQTRRAERVYLDVLRTQQPQSFVNEYQLGGKDFFFEISAYPSKDDISVFVKDITKRKRAEEQLAHMATHDALTNLPNRTLFNDRLTLALAHAQRNQQMLAVMLLDLDHFKDVNDILGHSVGDKLLQIVSDRLASLLRKSDTVARMGGDEFMLLLPEAAREEDVAKIATKILETFREPFAFDDHELHVTTSIGIAIYPNDGGDADALMRNADIAMYRAKDRGRDNYQRYTSAMKVKALE